MAVVRDGPHTLLFSDRRWTRPDGHESHTKIHASRGLIWATAGAAAVRYRGEIRSTAGLIGAFLSEIADNGSFDLDELIQFLAPLVAADDRPGPTGVHVLLGRATAPPIYMFLPAKNGEIGWEEIEHGRIIPSPHTVGYFGSYFPDDRFFPPRGSSPHEIMEFMCPMLEEAIAYAQETAGPDNSDVAGPIDVAIVNPGGGGQILKESI